MSDPTPLTFNIPLEWKGKTIDSFLRNQMHFSRSILRSLKKEAGIRINGQAVPAWYQLNGGELLEIHLPLVEQNINPEQLPLTVLYDDQDLIIIDKPPGMLVHPVKRFQSGTIANALIYRWRAAGETCSFHPLHRLDRLTSGLVLIAKNQWAHQQLSRQLNSGKISRLYLAFCHGKVEKVSGKIDAPIKEQNDSALRIIDPEGKPAVTRYRVIRQTESSSLLAVKIFTGRTHQIRAHLAYLTYPIWGDPLYGINDQNPSRTALHAVSLSFIQPRLAKKIKIKAALPDDLKNLAERLGL